MSAMATDINKLKKQRATIKVSITKLMNNIKRIQEEKNIEEVNTQIAKLPGLTAQFEELSAQLIEKR